MMDGLDGWQKLSDCEGLLIFVVGEEGAADLEVGDGSRVTSAESGVGVEEK